MNENDPTCGNNTYGDTEIEMRVGKTQRQAERDARNAAWNAAEKSVKEVRAYRCPSDCYMKRNVKDTLNQKPVAPKILMTLETQFGWICIAYKTWEVTFECYKPGKSSLKPMPRPE